jgi:NhaP-type Na+/H+ or K+/H+ antiporter
MIFGYQGILGVVAVVCIILVIYDVFANQKRMKPEMKIVWTILAILFSIITAIVYYFAVKKK